ncbi:MAG: endopeptidase La [Clostridia bacterium]|nr:endopeptidase La [Clostridia bacterium]
MAVMPVYDTIVIPGATVYLRTQDYVKGTGRQPVTGERVTFVVEREETERASLTNESFYPIGSSGTITEVNGGGYIALRIQNRVNIDEVTVLQGGSISLTVTRRPDVDDLDVEEAEKRVRSMRDAILAFCEKYQWGPMIRLQAQHWNTMWEIAGALSPFLYAEDSEKYALLAEDTLQARFDMAERMLRENLELARVNTEAQTAQQEDYQKLYREDAIKKQMSYLQKELDGMHPENVTDVRRLELKLEEAGMNETALKEGRRVLNRLKSEGGQGPEAGMLMDYLELLTSLPWQKTEGERIALGDARAVLDRDHAGLEKVKKRILQQIAVMTLRGRQSGSILCFVGAPGTGKTSIGQSIASALGRKYVRVSLGGVRDEADIRGHRRTYIGSMPGGIMDGIHKSGVSNPVMVLDEIDKLSASYAGDPASALLEVLDPEQNSNFTDHYLNVPFDLSDVFFICTANTLDTIPEPLLNRIEVIQFQGYTPLEKMEIARDHLLPKAMEAAGLEKKDLEVEEKALEKVIGEYTREAGVRGLKKRMDMICRAAAVQLVEEPGKAVRVTEENIRDFMDMHPVRQNRVPEKTKPGIVTGLAWTPVGGEILYIQTLLTKGEGHLTVTGRLGDVMKESAQIAVSLVKAFFPEQAADLKKSDMHIHVPDGATPKDGPSAGITLTTALSSLVTGVAVPPDVAMTGEVSLQGDVRAIGGLPEKLMAAQRAGVKTVFIPTENREDLKDVAQEVRDAMKIIPVSSVEEVLSYLGMQVYTLTQAG